MLDIADFIIKLEEEGLSEVVKKIQPKALVFGKEKESQKNIDLEIEKAINFQNDFDFHFIHDFYCDYPQFSK